MKHNHNHDNAKNPGPQPEPVHFEFTDPRAKVVCIAGTFNDWQPEAKPMHLQPGGHWSKESALLPGIYEYRLVVDGQWMADPQAGESVPNPFGGRNSILRVAGSTEATHLTNAEHEPMRIANAQT